MIKKRLDSTYVEASLLKLIGFVLKRDPNLVQPSLSVFSGGYPLSESTDTAVYRFSLARLCYWWQLSHQIDSLAVVEGVIEEDTALAITRTEAEHSDLLTEFIRCLYQGQLNHRLTELGCRFELADGSGKVLENYYRLSKIDTQ